MCRPDVATAAKTAPPHQPVPAIAAAYLAVYRSLPAVRVPGTDLDVSFTLLSAFLLAAVRFASEHVLVNSFGWPGDGNPTTGEAAAGCASICHSVLLCAGLIVAFAVQKYDVVAVLKTQTDRPWWPEFADSLLQLCTGYMVYDTFIGVLYVRWDPTTSSFAFTPDDYLFLMHHAMTGSYMTSARVLGAGYMSAFICMLLGEITNPLQNAWLVGKMATNLDCCNGHSMTAFTEAVRIAFAASYFAIRCVIAPPYFAHTTYCLLFTKKGRENVPLALSSFWALLIWGVCFGSASWIAKCYGILEEVLIGNGGAGGVEGEL